MTATTPPSPDPTASPDAAPAPLEPGQAWSLGAEAPEESVQAAKGLKEAVASKSQTAGSLLEGLDAVALEVGEMRISLLDGLVVLGIILLVIGFAWLASRASRSLLKRFTKLDDTQHLLAEKITTILIWGAAIFLAIDLLGIDLTALAVFSGAFGLAIGFGLQKTFGNLIAGIILLMDKSIKPGDVIAVADLAGNESFGQIRKIGIRAVSVTTRDQREYLIPNENLMINQVENWSYSSRNVRMQVPVGVSYGADLELAEKLMLDAAKNCDRVLKSPPPTAWLHEYGDSSVNFVVQVWINDPEEGVGNVRSAVLKNLWKLFAENDIEIPFPQRDINLRNNQQFERLIEALAAREESRSKN